MACLILLGKCPINTTKMNFLMVYNGNLMEIIGISVMISIGLLLIFLYYILLNFIPKLPVP